MSPSGSFLFVEVIDTPMEIIQTFKVDSASGALTAAATLQRPQSCIPGVCPSTSYLAVRSDGKYLYLLDQDLANDVTTVTPYAIDSVTGGLTAGTAVTLPLDQGGTSMAIDPLGRFLYVANSAGGGPLLEMSATVVSYVIDPMSGALTPSSTSAVANGASLMVPDPTGHYLYAVYYGGTAFVSNIVPLSVDPSSGALSPIGAAVPISVSTLVAACDPAGTFLFLGNSGGAPFSPPKASWNDLTAFTIATSGVDAGTVSLSGQGLPFGIQSGATAPGGELAIVE